MEFHDTANIFPMMQDDEYAALVEDIRANGLLEPIWTHEGKIVDGRNRWRACRALGVKPTFRQWDGNGSLVAFVVSLNLKRRHLSSSQRAVIALEVDRQLQAEAKANMAAGGGDKRSEAAKSGLSMLTNPIAPIHARSEAAKAVGVSEGYISDAKRIERNAPELLERVRDGSLSVPEAKKLSRVGEVERKAVIEKLESGESKSVKGAIKQAQVEERDRAAVASSHNGGGAAVIITARSPKAGEFWRLGRHTLYCGDTRNYEFINAAPSCPFAFADPPYNANAAEWDSAFEWGHDWLATRADVVVVTPGIVSIFDFARATQMPYLWSVACWIDNGMTRGAMGFGNWIYAALFSEESIHRGTQDHFRVSIKTGATGETSHKGRKPAEFVAWLMGLYSQKGETVIDPFLGSGTTLLVAEAMGRTCYGGELNPAYCAAIIARWEQVTGEQAEREV